MSVRVLTGDCRDVLRTLPEQSFHTCVTSPPYFGLRDYGTAKWDGGDEGCDHAEMSVGMSAKNTLGPTGHLPETNAANVGRTRQFRTTCAKCGARRIDSQLGLEPTPHEFVAALVEVFREVRRVLRDDGTVWLNLGSSYMTQPGKGDNVPQTKWKKNTYPKAAPHRVKQSASDGKRASRSRQPQSDPACDTDGKAPLGCSAPDCVYRGRGGEPQGGSQSHHGRTARNGRQTDEGGERPCTTDHDSGHQGSAEASPGASPRVSQGSNVPASSEHGRAACVPVATASASLPPPPTSSDGAPLSADRLACTCDTGSTSAPSDQSTSGTSSSGLACGCGSCGICWASLAIPLLRLKPKDEINIPHFVAMALQADGWYLRQTIVWSKSNPMPESVRDRCTKSHEYLFLLSKSPRYYWDREAMQEDALPASIARYAYAGGDTRINKGGAYKEQFDAKSRYIGVPTVPDNPQTRNRRSVWTITTQPYSEAHFATFPPALVEPCIKAGSPVGGHVLDPFGGAGTTGLVADRLQRNATLIELNPAYADMARARLSQDAGMFAEVAGE